MAETIDHEARHRADRAMDAIQAHETLCGERWEQSRKASDALADKVERGFAASDGSRARLHDRIDAVNHRILYGVIALLAGGVTSIGSVAWYLATQIAQMKGLLPS